MISIQIAELCSEQKCGLMSLVPDGTRAHNPFGVPPITPNIVAPLLIKACTPWLRAWTKPSVAFLIFDEFLPGLVELIPAHAVRNVPRPVERRPAVHLQRRCSPDAPLRASGQTGAVNGKWGVVAMNRISEKVRANDVATLAADIASPPPHIVTPSDSAEGRELRHDLSNGAGIRQKLLPVLIAVGPDKKTLIAEPE